MTIRGFGMLVCMASLIFSCNSESDDSYDGEFSGSSSEGSGDSTLQSGVITAGEWNDLYHWEFWQELMQDQQYSEMDSYWGFNANQRVSVKLLRSDGQAAAGVPMDLLDENGEKLYSAMSDNRGRAEFWPGLFSQDSLSEIAAYLIVSGQDTLLREVHLYTESGENEIVYDPSTQPQKRAMISFVVDATGSMNDEMQYLKVELEDVIQRAENQNPGIEFLTSAVFYRDAGDDYLTRQSGFTTRLSTTIDFIKAQKANGGGDFPEAVHTALDKSLQMQWNTSAREKIIFLLLDAPPHYQNQVLDSYHKSITEAAARGIKIIPITASGIDKKTEFLMRLSAMASNGTYVFITNHSGIGNEHLEPTVGDYQVEYLNELMLRLINQNL